MFGFLGRILLRPIVMGILGLAAVFEGYQLFGPTEDSLGFMRRNLAERVCAKAADDLPKRQNVSSIAVLNLAGDSTGFVTRLLRERVEASGKYQLIEQSFLRKLLREFGREDAPVSRLVDAVATARKLGVDAIVFGEMAEFSATDQGATLKLELRMAERDSGQAVFARSYSESMSANRASTSYWRSRLADSSKGRRILIWVLFALLLPLVTAPLIRRLTAEESNAINLSLLISYTLVDLLAALLLTGFWIPTLWTAGILLLALAGSAYYNYRIATFIEEMNN